MKVTSKIKINQTAIKAITAKAQAALEQTADLLQTEVQQAQVIPRMDGHLQGEAMFVDKSESKYGRVSIVHSTPYARRLYYHPEYNFKKDENPNAKAHWFEDWQKGGKHEDFCNKAFAIIMRRLMR
ncbi:MAG: minor capsid protein [Pseudoruminococcus massiliensis]|uniref:minor capsid protein n=1 Tax=Pseudoruminococcus massiliensis TaxID=2086583 RepID=UPI003994EFE3